MKTLNDHIEDWEALRKYFAFVVRRWGTPSDEGKPFYDADVKRLRDTEATLESMRAELAAGGTIESWREKQGVLP